MAAIVTTVTAETVATRAGLRGEGAVVEAGRLLELAVVELGEALEGAFRQPPAVVVDEMVLRVAVDAARATRTAGAGAQTTVEDGQQVRAPRDPLASVRPRLARYVVGMA